MRSDDPERGDESGSDPLHTLRWRLIRDLVIFATKASLEALRDIALIPAAFIAGLVGILFSPSRPDRYFQRVLEVGDEFDEFVDLFGKEKRRQAGSRFDSSDEDEDEGEGSLRVDDIFERIEQVMFDEYKRGGVTAQAKEAIDHSLDAVHEALGATVTSVSPGTPRDDDRHKDNSD